VDAANAAKADIMVAVQFNGIGSDQGKASDLTGGAGPYTRKSQALAQLVQASLVKTSRLPAYPTVDRGATSTASVLGPEQPLLPAVPESPMYAGDLDATASSARTIIWTNPTMPRGVSAIGRTKCSKR